MESGLAVFQLARRQYCSGIRSGGLKLFQAEWPCVLFGGHAVAGAENLYIHGKYYVWRRVLRARPLAR